MRAEEEKLRFEAGIRSAENLILEDINSSDVPPAFETGLNSLKDLRDWLHRLSEANQSWAPVFRLREALLVLEREGSRDARKQIQGLLKKWNIKQKKSKHKKINLPCAKQQLTSAVLAEARRLRSVIQSAGSLASHADLQNLFRSGDACEAPDVDARVRSGSSLKPIIIH